LAGKSEKFKLLEKIEIFRKFAWKIDFLAQIHDPRRSQTRLMPLHIRTPTHTYIPTNTHLHTI